MHWAVWRLLRALAIGGLVGFAATSFWAYLDAFLPAKDAFATDVHFSHPREFVGGLVFAAVTPLLFLHPIPRDTWAWATARGVAAAWATYLAFWLQDISQDLMHIDLIWPLLVVMGFMWGFFSAEPARSLWRLPANPRDEA